MKSSRRLLVSLSSSTFTTLALVGSLFAGAGDITLDSFEAGVGSWVPNPDAASVIAVGTTPTGATEGASALEITVTGNATANQWTASASSYWEDGTPISDYFEAAIADGPSNYVVEFDITFDPGTIDPGVAWTNISLVINSDQGFGGAYSGQDKLAVWGPGNGATTRTVIWPLSFWQLADEGFYQMIFIYNSNLAAGAEASFSVDNIRIRETGGLAEEMLFSFEDGTTQGWNPTDPLITPDWVPVTSLAVSPANATEGTRSLQLVTPASGWTYGASSIDYTNPALDEALFLLADFTVPTSIPNFNQVIMVMFEPDTNNWQQLDVWIGGSSGQKTLTMPLRRTGTGPVEFHFGYASPSNPATVYMDNVRIIKSLPFVDPTPPAPFEVTSMAADTILGEVNLTWNSQLDATYSVWTAPDLRTWVELVDGVPSGGETTNWSDPFTDFTANPILYYQVRGPAVP